MDATTQPRRGTATDMTRRDLYCLVAGILLALLVANARPLRAARATQRPDAGAGVDARTLDLLRRARDLNGERDQILAELADWLSGEQSSDIPPEQLEEGLRLLGDLHGTTPAVVTAAVERLRFRRPHTGGIRSVLVPPDPLEEYPGWRAVAHIGLPAVPPLVHQVRTEQDANTRHWSVICLGRLLGKHSESWLSEALRQERNAKRKARLEEALQHGGFRGPGAYGSYIWFFRGTEQPDPWYDRKAHP